jgi:hypothetical protein
MNFISVLLLALLTLCGCGRYHRAGDAPSSAPKVVLRGSAECRRADDPAFSPRERQIIAAARRHLEQPDKRSIDAYYHVKHSPNGYEVFVIYVTGYDRSEPSFIPGGFCTVVLQEDGTIIKVLPGA